MVRLHLITHHKFSIGHHSIHTSLHRSNYSEPRNSKLLEITIYTRRLHFYYSAILSYTIDAQCILYSNHKVITAYSLHYLHNNYPSLRKTDKCKVNRYIHKYRVLIIFSIYTNLLNSGFKYPICRWISDHNTGQVFLVLINGFLPVVQADLTCFVSLQIYNIQPC